MFICYENGCYKTIALSYACNFVCITRSIYVVTGFCYLYKGSLIHFVCVNEYIFLKTHMTSF